jgi:hypothetical protein
MAVAKTENDASDMPLSDQQRVVIQQQFARGDQRTKTLVPLFCGVVVVVVLVGLGVGASSLVTIGLAVALTVMALTVVGVVLKAWIRRRI